MRWSAQPAAPGAETRLRPRLEIVRDVEARCRDLVEPVQAVPLPGARRRAAAPHVATASRDRGRTPLDSSLAGARARTLEHPLA